MAVLMSVKGAAPLYTVMQQGRMAFMPLTIVAASYWHISFSACAQAAKSKLEKGFGAATPSRFKAYFKTPSFDKLARACLQYFLAVVEQDALSVVRRPIVQQQAQYPILYCAFYTCHAVIGPIAVDCA